MKSPEQVIERYERKKFSLSHRLGDEHTRETVVQGLIDPLCQMSPTSVKGLLERTDRSRTSFRTERPHIL